MRQPPVGSVTCIAKIERWGLELEQDKPVSTYWVEFTEKVERGPSTWLFQVTRKEWQAVAVGVRYGITPIDGDGPRTFTRDGEDGSESGGG